MLHDVLGQSVFGMYFTFFKYLTITIQCEIVCYNIYFHRVLYLLSVSLSAAFVLLVDWLLGFAHVHELLCRCII